MEFVTANFQIFHKNIDEESVECIYDLLEGNTFCMQKTFNQAFDQTEPNQECRTDLLHQIILEILSDKERDFQNILSNVASRPKELLVAIAIDGFVDKPTSAAFIRRHQLQSASSVQSAIKQLLQYELITYHLDKNDKKVYRVSDPFLKLWLQQSFNGGFTFPSPSQTNTGTAARRG